jgi:hypothetical protein
MLKKFKRQRFDEHDGRSTSPSIARHPFHSRDSASDSATRSPMLSPASLR